MQDRIIAKRIHKSKKSLLLLGPRQVGKSSLCKLLNPKITFNLADESLFLEFAKDPGRLKRELNVLSKETLILVDEIQRLPSLMNTVQMIIDQSEGKFRFLLTASSARKLKRGEANLLPGRVILEHLDPFSYFEVKDHFDLDRALQVGMLPEVYLNREEGIEILSSYTETYLREEIQSEALVKNIGDYARFLDIAALTSGQWINYSKMSSDAEIPKETIRRFFSILEDTLLVFRLPPFHPKQEISRRTSQRDKFLFFDVGVRNSLLDLHFRKISPNQIGNVFEQWFILQVIYLNRAYQKRWHLSAYRTEAGAEVDLVIELSDHLIGIEIKSGKNVDRGDLRGLRSLGEITGTYKPLKKWIAYRGDSKQIFDTGETVFPYLDLLEALVKEN